MNWLVFLLYCVPTLLCLVAYAGTTVLDIRAELASRAEHGESYLPRLKYGHIVGRILLSAVPGLNAWLLVREFAPTFSAFVFRTLGRVINVPVIK